MLPFISLFVLPLVFLSMPTLISYPRSSAPIFHLMAALISCFVTILVSCPESPTFLSHLGVGHISCFRSSAPIFCLIALLISRLIVAFISRIMIVLVSCLMIALIFYLKSIFFVSCPRFPAHFSLLMLGSSYLSLRKFKQ